MAAPELITLPDDITHFYRYSNTKHLDWLKPVILKHEIYVPTAKQLNDPRECRPRFLHLDRTDIARYLKKDDWRRNPHKTLEQRADACGEIDTFLRLKSPEEVLRHLANLLYERTEKTRIFSMSKRWNNVAMWAKYADEHRGYCLEFAKVDWFTIARPVLYDDSLFLDLRNQAAEVVFAWTHYKSPEWTNEEEIRLVFSPTAEPQVPVGPNALTRILLGKNMSDVDRTQILRWARQRDPELVVMNVEFDQFTQELSLRPASQNVSEESRRAVLPYWQATGRNEATNDGISRSGCKTES